MSASDPPRERERPGVLSRSVLGRLVSMATPVLLALGGSVLVVAQRERVRDVEAGSLAARGRLDLGREVCSRELDSARSILLHLSEQSLLQSALADRSTRGPLAEEYLRLCRNLDAFDQIRWLDPEGQEVIRIDRQGGRLRVVEPDGLQSKADRYYFQGARQIPIGTVYVSRFDLNVEHGEVERPFRPVLRLATPIRGAGGEPGGVLVVNYLGSKILDWVSALTRPREGALWLIDPEGHHLEHPDPANSWGFVFGRDPSFATESPVAWEQLRGGELDGLLTAAGLFHGDGVPFNGESEPAEDFGLFLVAFTPRESLFAPSGRVIRAATLGAGVAGLLALAVIWRLAFVGATRAWNERRLEISEKRARELLRRLLDIEEVERSRLARDLHDEVGQFATAVTIGLKRAQRAEESAIKDQCIDRALDGTAGLLESVHRIASQLRSSVLDDIGLAAAIESLAEEVAEGAGVRVELQLDLGGRNLHPRLAENVYRIIQEALTNVVRHARTDRAEIRMELGSADLRISIVDFGEGIRGGPPEAARFGIVGMRERAELLGGTLGIQSEPGKGTEVVAVLPIDPPESEPSEPQP